MGWLRGMRRLMGLGVGALLLIPILALVPAAFVDRGPDGAARGTIVPAALAVWDPYLWAGLRNSVAMATAVALGSMVVGLALAVALSRWSFWGRGPLSAIARAPMAVPPLFGAVGLRYLLAGSTAGSSPSPLDGWAGWMAMGWVELACAVPWVVGRTAGALRRVDPSWVEVARSAGAGGRRTARDLTWPLVRPEAARAASTIFALTLFEPGAPLALGLRRTLAFQAVEAATREGQAPRAATIALMALIVATAGRGLIRLWGRTPPAIPPGARPSRPAPSPAPAAAGLVLALGFWSALALAPAFGLIAATTRPRVGPGGRPEISIGAFRDLASGGEASRFAVHSVLLGGLAGGLALALAKGLRRGVPNTVPPLAIGIGALMIPGLLEAEADWRRDHRSEGPASRLMRLASDGLDPCRAPGVLVTWALATVQVPALALAVERARGLRRPVLIESARGLGASRRRARRDVAGPWLRSPVGSAWLLAAALSASDASASLVLAPTSRGMTVGPGARLLLGDPDGLPIAAALAFFVIALNLAALARAGWGTADIPKEID